MSLSGNELAKLISNFKGPVYITACAKHDVFYVKAVKSDLIEHFKSVGNTTSGCIFDLGDSGKCAYVDSEK